MLVATKELLRAAQSGRYAIGAFNVYNLEGVKAVIEAAEAERSPVILQIHPSAYRFGGQPLVALCLAAARQASVPLGVHLDHSTSADEIREALEAGMPSIMADGSHLPYAENVAFSREMVTLAHARGAAVEVELGRLTGTEDGLTVAEREGKLTEPHQAADFVRQTGAAALAVCIGNVHGHYHSEPRLDLDRLRAIRRNVSVPLVLHGASGLPADMVQQAIAHGVCKFNVNTEVRDAYLESLSASSQSKTDLLDIMKHSCEAMRVVAVSKIRLFCSAGKA